MALLIDPEQMALYGPFIAGGFGVFGTLLGVALGLFGERWVRTRGKVRCDIRWWASLRKELVDAPGGLEVTERRLETTFLNRKDVPVTVWEMGVTFYKGASPSTRRSARASSS